MPTMNTQVLFRAAPAGMPTQDCFDIVETPLPRPDDGQFLVENLYLSLDPYMRMLMGGGWMFRGGGLTPGQIMVGRTIGRVTKTQNENFAEGDLIVGGLGWQTHAVSDGGNIDFRITPRDNVPLSAYLGACGNSGTTAWFGLKLIGAPKPGETVLVSAAAGSVGSVVGQLAKVWGCRAIGIAGGDEKCAVVTGEFGFDACCNYKADDLAGQIAAVAPNGVDVYFDNVGGEMLDGILPLLNNYARVPACGVLSQYNADGDWQGVRNTRLIFDKRLRLQGFLQSDFADRGDVARAELANLVGSGKLRVRETVAEGLANAPSAFIDMLNGANMGKQLVKLR